MNKIQVKISSLILIFLFLLVNLNSMTSSNQSVSQSPNVFIYDKVSLLPDTLDPALNHNLDSSILIQEIYEGLFSYENNSAVMFSPCLALNYSISPDGLQYTFTLRHNVTFIDQQPFNAYIMQYSLDRAILMNDQSSNIRVLQNWVKGGKTLENMQDVNISQANTFLALQGIRAINDYTLAINLTNPFGGFLSTLVIQAASAISPRAIIDNEPNSYTINQSDNAFGMVSLRNIFPDLTSNQILYKLSLPETYNIANSGIVPQVNMTSPARISWLDNHTDGTGPYKIQTLIPSIHAILVRNDNWWNNDIFGPHSIDEIDINVVTESATRILDLTTGAVDMADIDSDKLSQIFNWNSITQSPNSLYPSTVQIIPYNSIVGSFIGMNENTTLSVRQIVEASDSNYGKGSMNCSNLLQYSWNDSQGNPQIASCSNPFSSLLFRKAFAYAFDYNTFISSAFTELRMRLNGVIPLELLGHDDNLIINGSIPSFDLSIAKSLFQQVGFKGSVTITYNTGSNAKAIAVNLLKNAIEQLNIGITINLQNFAYSTFLSKIQNGKLAGYVLDYTPIYADPNDPVQALLQSNIKYASFQHYNNSFVDQLINQGVGTTDPTLRASIYHQIEVNSTGDYPFIYLDQPKNIYFVSTRISGLNESTTNGMNPMLFGLNYQYLSKIESSTPSNASSFSNSFSTSSFSISSKSNSTFLSPNFSFDIKSISITLIFSLFVIVFYATYASIGHYAIKKNIPKSNQHFFSNLFKKKERSNNFISPVIFEELEQIIEENKK